MFSIIKNKFLLHIINIAVILLCVAGLYLISIKADLPFNTSSKGSYHLISELSENDNVFAKGDTITSIDGYFFSGWEETEVYLDGKNINDIVNVEILRSNEKIILPAKLVKFYSRFDLIIILIVGFVYLSMAIFVGLKSPNNKSAAMFHLASLGLGVVIVVNAGNYIGAPLGFGYLSRVIWLFAYNFMPVFFISLTYSLTGDQQIGSKKYLPFLYAIAIINAVILSYFFLASTLGGEINRIKQYVFYFDSVFRVFLIVCIASAILVCIRAYKLSTELRERKKIKWLLLGFFIGPFSFIIFWVLPIILLGHELIPEALMLISLIAVPITFGIAIVKYQFMDIDLIIRRSVVYSVILALIILIYIGLTSFITLFVKDVNPAIPSVITALLVAIMLQPIKNSVQKFVDKKFFRLEYNYRVEQIKFIKNIKNSNSIKSLAEKIITQTNVLIPVQKIAFFKLRYPDNKLLTAAQNGFDIIKNRTIRLEIEKLQTDLSLPIALDDLLEKGIEAESADIEVFKRWGMALAIPVKSPSGEIHGFIVLGKKKSGARFFIEDIDLLITVASTAALAIDRIQLQEELMLEQIEYERLEELNKLKSSFVSNVTHELKDPLTSINMFSELLHNKKNISDKKSKEYLQIIEGESERLNRLIDNVLDFAKIEKGIKSYTIKSVSLNEIIDRALKSFEYQFKIAKISIEKILSKNNIIINADADAVQEAVLNLLSNAIKYSNENSKVVVCTSVKNHKAAVEVTDNGNGISSSDLKNIFEPFFRSEDGKTLGKSGTGLGLPIVKDIMNAHKGKVDVKSIVGEGSKFTLLFPMEE